MDFECFSANQEPRRKSVKRTMGKSSVSWQYLLKLSQFKVYGLEEPAGAVL